MSMANAEPTDLLGAIEEALRLTLLLDLHLTRQRDVELAKAAEELGWRVQNLRPVWPRSAASSSASLRLQPFWKHFRDEAKEIQELTEGIAQRLETLEAQIPTEMVANGYSDSLPDWAEAAKRSREPLTEIWSLLAELLRSRAQDPHPTRLTVGQGLNEKLTSLRQGLVPRLLLPADPHRQPQAFLIRLRGKIQLQLERHLTRRIAATWSIQGRNLNQAFRGALKSLAFPSREVVKRGYVKLNFWPALRALRTPQRVRIGQQYEKRKATSVRIRSTRPDGRQKTRESVRSLRLPRGPGEPSPARLWPDELPVYRTWRWITNKTINGAEADLLEEYGRDGDDSPTQIRLSTKPADGMVALERPPEFDRGKLTHDQHSEVEARLKAQADSITQESNAYAEFEARTCARALEEADLTSRQAEAWLRTEELAEETYKRARTIVGFDLPDEPQSDERAAKAMDISASTLRTHRRRAREKLSSVAM